MDDPDLLHNRALAHAHTAMAALEDAGKNGKYIELESGQPVSATFYFFHGIRLVLRMENFTNDMLWQVTTKVPDDVSERLAFYRGTLIKWQSTAENPLTFRHFNVLLAALSFSEH
jgi:hypothetical protein